MTLPALAAARSIPSSCGASSTGDRSEEDPNSPRNVINAFYYVPPFRAAREEDFLTASLMEKMGDDRYPGDMVPSENWPNVAPGVWGPINAGSPKYVLEDVPALIAVQPKAAHPLDPGQRRHDRL